MMQYSTYTGQHLHSLSILIEAVLFEGVQGLLMRDYNNVWEHPEATVH